LNKRFFINANDLKNIILIFLLFQFNNKLLSQDLNKIDGFAINPKIGPAFTKLGGNNLPSAGIEINILKNKFIYSLDYIAHNFLDQNQIGIMMGKYKGEKYFRIQYKAGINIFWGKHSTTGTTQPWFNTSRGSSSSFYTVGAITKVGLKFIPLKNLSIGTDLLINLNFKNTMFMPMLTIEIGKLRDAIESHING
tara:strand:+ start:133 stop:714 length:582 start_codon:yes stop_codon:yes gene_type:complete